MNWVNPQVVTEQHKDFFILNYNPELKQLNNNYERRTPYQLPTVNTSSFGPINEQHGCLKRFPKKRLQQILLMGSCASSHQHSQKRELPLVYHVQKDKQKQLTNRLNELEFQLSNVSIVPSLTTEVELSFAITGYAHIPMQKNTRITQELENPQYQGPGKSYQIKWTQMDKLDLSLSDQQLVETYLSVYLNEDNKSAVQVVKISLYLIVNGPYHHNILVPINKQQKRVIFDAKISHIFEINTKVEQLSLNLNRSSVDLLNPCYFTIRAIRQELVIADSPQSYSIDPRQFTQAKPNTQNYFQQKRPNISKLKQIQRTFSQDGQKTTLLNWSTLNQLSKQIKMPEVTFDSSTLEIASYSIQIAVWSEVEKKSEYMCEANLPLWRLLDREYIKDKMNSQDLHGNLVSLEDRMLSLTERLYCHQDVIGTCLLQLHILNEKLIQQSKYSSRTEQGVVNLRPSTFSKSIKSNSKTIDEIWRLSDKIDRTVKEQSSKLPIQEVQARIEDILRQIYEKLKTTLNQVLYSDANKFQALINNQNIFISLMFKLSTFTEDAQNSSLSQISWAIIIGFLKRREFSLENLSLKGIYKSQESKIILNKKRDVALKYQEVIYKLISNALKCYGLYSSNNNMLSHFLSFCYFRVPIFREYFLQVMDFQNNYTEMQTKLQIFQREIEPKTSFGSNFAQIKGDWKCNFFDQIEQFPKSKQLAKQLQSSFKSKKFFVEISYKDETMLNFFSLLLKSLCYDSSQKADKWKYIEGYSKIVAIILTQLKQKDVTKYSPLLIKISIDLLENQHLISQMLPLICDQTNIHDAQKVQVALDLMQEYFDATTKKKQKPFPTSFNSNYLLKVSRIVIEGENGYAISRFLVIIYHFFDQLGPGFKLQIFMYLTGKVFFKLFYHWSSEVRYTFYLIMLIKIQHLSSLRTTELGTHVTKLLSMIKILARIHDKDKNTATAFTEKVLYRRMKLKIREKMRAKKYKNYEKDKSQYSLQHVTKFLDDQSILTQFPSAQSLTKNRSEVQATPHKQNRFIENEEIDLQIPGKSERSFSDKLIVPEQILNKTPSYCDLEGGASKLNSRKKRRPSLFVYNLIINQNPKAQITPIISNQLQQLSELTEEEIRNIGIATNHFNEVSRQLMKYCQTHGGAFPNSDYIDIKKNVVNA